MVVMQKQCVMLDRDQGKVVEYLWLIWDSALDRKIDGKNHTEWIELLSLFNRNIIICKTNMISVEQFLLMEKYVRICERLIYLRLLLVIQIFTVWEAHLTSKMETLWPLKQNPAIQFAVSVGFDYSVPNGLYNPGLLYKHAVEGSLAVERWGTLDMWINH